MMNTVGTFLTHCTTTESCTRHIFSSLSLMGLLSGLNVMIKTCMFPFKAMVLFIDISACFYGDSR